MGSVYHILHSGDDVQCCRWRPPELSLQVSFFEHINAYISSKFNIKCDGSLARKQDTFLLLHPLDSI